MTTTNLQNRTIFCRDNIDVLKGINSNSIDLIYLDPPFSKNDTFISKNNKNIEKIKNFFIQEQKKYNRFSDEDFNEIFKDNTASFSDIWTENDINKYHYTEIDKYNNQLVAYLDSIKNFAIKGGFYYLLYMTVRLIEMKRILKETGSIYLHCDPTLSHYIKAVMDRIFGVENFRNEISWKRTYAHNDPKRFGKNQDIIFFYTKTDEYFFNPIKVPYEISYIDNFFRHKDEKGKYQLVVLTGPGKSEGESDTEWRGYRPSRSGRHWSIPKRIVNALVGERQAEQMSIVDRLELLYKNGYIVFSKNNIPRFKSYLDDLEGAPVQEIWTDINPISSQSKERVGYPTQKPLSLLERIIKASSKKGDLILDPFCGCATTCIASEKLGRQWIGVDWNPQSFYMIYYRAYLMDILGTEHAPTLFGNLIQETNMPQRTDISSQDLEKIQKEYQSKQEIKKTKKVKMSLEDKQIAKELLYEEQTGMCNGCDVYMRSVELTIDHITPQSKQGDDDLDNLQLLCHRCNNWKRDKSMKILFDKLFEERIISLGTYNKQMAKTNSL